jgi:hypothetical protein
MNCPDNDSLLICKLYFLYYMIISLPCLRPSGLLQSFAIVYRVCPKVFVHLFGDWGSQVGFLSEAFEEDGFLR